MEGRSIAKWDLTLTCVATADEEVEDVRQIIQDAMNRLTRELSGRQPGIIVTGPSVANLDSL